MPLTFLRRYVCEAAAEMLLLFPDAILVSSMPSHRVTTCSCQAQLVQQLQLHAQANPRCGLSS